MQCQGECSRVLRNKKELYAAETGVLCHKGLSHWNAWLDRQSLPLAMGYLVRVDETLPILRPGSEDEADAKNGQKQYPA